MAETMDINGTATELVSKKPYRGVNHFLLSATKYVSPFWLTYRQATDLGYYVRKGEETNDKDRQAVEKPSDSKRTYTLRLRSAVVSGRLTQHSK